MYDLFHRRVYHKPKHTLAPLDEVAMLVLLACNSLCEEPKTGLHRDFQRFFRKTLYGAGKKLSSFLELNLLQQLHYTAQLWGLGWGLEVARTRFKIP